MISLTSSSRTRSLKKGMCHALSWHDVLDMLVEQGGRCAYSGVAMEILIPCSNWRVSIERRDRSKGYVRDNCVLVAGEFNSPDFSRCRGVREQDIRGTAQWSTQKASFVSNCDAFSVDIQRLHLDVNLAREVPRLSVGPRREYSRAYSRTLRGRAMTLASSARKRTPKMGQACEIEYGDILQMLLVQGGRCFYSGVPLRYDQPHVDW